MPKDNEQKPHDKGLGEYAKDFVGGLFGRDDDDAPKPEQTQQTQQTQSNEEQKPHDKGIAEYTKDFVGGLFGRDDDDKPQQSQAPAPKPEADSLAERLSEKASEVTQQAQQQRQGAPSFTDRLHDTIRDAAQQAQQAQTHSAGPVAPSQAPKPAGQADESEVERLRNRISELERQLNSAPAAQSAPPPQAHRSYTVVPGDSLRRIAQRHYGDEMQWKRIYEANRDKISNPDLIHPGQVFEIPE